MSIYLSLFLLILGIVLVIIGGNIFVDASINLGNKLRIPSIIVGATFVSIATTLPELFVSTFSATTNAGLAVGNALGSVICNTALVCGISMAVLPAVVKEKTSLTKYFLLLGALVLLFVFGINYNIGLIESIIMLLIFVAFMVFNIVDAKKQSKQEKINFSKDVLPDEQSNENEEAKNDAILSKKERIKLAFANNIWLIILSFIVGAGILVGGAEAMVTGAENVCKTLGISDALIGLTVVAIGTSLPELVTTITSIKKKTASLGYGNIIGANILNLTLIMGLCGVINGNNGLGIGKRGFLIDLPVAIGVSLIFVLPLMLKNKTYKWQGISLLTIYALYFTACILIEVLKLGIA